MTPLARSAPPEPIAIIGMACRFPGANDIESFWHLLETGGNAVAEGEPGSGEGRWGQIFGERPARSDACRFGAFVDDIDLFDDAFFRISPVEAELLDPQQRMMLEVSWQALEDAGIDPVRLRGSRTGVYSGISNDEYRMLVVDSAKPAEAASCLYALSGTNLNGTAGRVSFVPGLTGPAKAVDAAHGSSGDAPRGGGVLRELAPGAGRQRAQPDRNGRHSGHPQHLGLRGVHLGGGGDHDPLRADRPPHDPLQPGAERRARAAGRRGAHLRPPSTRRASEANDALEHTPVGSGGCQLRDQLGLHGGESPPPHAIATSSRRFRASQSGITRSSSRWKAAPWFGSATWQSSCAIT